MRLIRAPEAAPRPIAFSFEDLAVEAQRIIADAEAQARRIVTESVQKARQAVEHERARAEATGLAAGRAAGREQLMAEARETLLAEARHKAASLGQALAAALDEFDQQKRQMLAEAEAGLIELALAIAERVCKQTLKPSETARTNAAALLELTRDRDHAELRFHPADLEVLSQSDPAALAALQQAEHIRIVADPEVPAGGCRLVTRAGLLDATLETQLDRVARALTGRAVDPGAPGEGAAS